MTDDHAPSLRVVCFDLSGVLVRICRDWKHACEQVGIEYRPLPSSPALQQRIGIPT